MTNSPPRKVKSPNMATETKVLASGFDTLVLAVDVSWKGRGLFEDLEEWKRAAKGHDDGKPIILQAGGVFGKIVFNLKPFGKRGYEWILLAIPLVLIFAIAYTRFFFHLPPNIRILVFLAALIYIGGVIGGEMFSGWYASKFGEGDANYIMLTIFEETLEMSGIIVFIHALLLYLYNEPIEKLSQA